MVNSFEQVLNQSLTLNTKYNLDMIPYKTETKIVHNNDLYCVS
jgi:hypothetical protein